MEFQRKPVPFLHRGMNWNSPVEKLQDGQVCWAKNIRILQQGTVSNAHGHTEVFPGFNALYLHSISRLNILNEQRRGEGLTPAFDPNLSRTYVVGGDTRLYVFQDNDTLQNATGDINPVRTPGGRDDAFSGNPLSIIDAQPSGAAVAWKYIGDSKQMVTVGYYPGDSKGNMCHALTIGLDPPINTTDITIWPTGHLVGAYQWAFAYRRVPTGARSNPSAASRNSLTVPAFIFHAIDGGAHVSMVLPVSPIDPNTGSPDPNVVVDVYRFGGTIFRWALVGSGPGGSTFYDNVPDLNLLAAPAPPQATDATTGLTRFNLFRPFVTQDTVRSGQATLAPRSNDTLVLTFDPSTQNGDLFNPQWLPGSTIWVTGPGVATTGGAQTEVACTIYQVLDRFKVELADNLTDVLDNGPVTWRTEAGTLMAGQPLSHIWGPYGIGQSGSYIFGCGDPNARGTLYWTNGNDPDSTDVVNNIIVTSPSEKLVTGCVYDGQPFCWSTERQFQIFPSLTVFGQFTAQEVAGAKGCWMEWSLSVQSNGLADQSVSWRGKDGIYDYSQSGLQRLTDPLYPFFPHDNNPGLAPETIMPFIGANSQHPEHVGNLDDTQPKYHRLCWFQGLLYYDFIANIPDPFNPNIAIPCWSTLVWDSINTGGGGWVSLDQPFPHTLNPIARGIDIGATDLPIDANPQGGPFGPIFGPMARGGSLKVGWGGTIFDYYGLTRGFESRFITRAEDLGDSRAQKRWGDYWLDCTPLNEFTVYPLAGFHHCQLEPVTVPGGAPTTPDFCPRPTEPGQRAQYILTFAEPAFANAPGAALLSPALGLDIRWVGADGQFSATLNQWQPSFVLKPEVISYRASDPDDMGALQAKYFTGMNLQANTFGQDCLLDVILDGALISQLQINHDDQSEHPYAFTPKAGYQMQVQMSYPQDIGGQPVTWQLFKINWIYEVWPDAVARDSFFSDLGYTGAKFMQGMVVPMETGGKPVSLFVQSDCGQSVLMGPVQTPDLCKMDIPFSFGPCNPTGSEPFIAHQVQIRPQGPARIWHDKIKWIFEPEPELVSTWVTQPTNHDMPTWHHLRDCWIAYRGGNGAPTLWITTEYGTESYPLDFVGPNAYTRCYRVLKPQKAKWRYYRVEGCGLFRLYIKDCAIRIKEWGSTGPYVTVQPFGDLSRSNGGARI